MAAWPRAPPAWSRRGRAGGPRRSPLAGAEAGEGGGGGRECLRPVLLRPALGDRGGLASGGGGLQWRSTLLRCCSKLLDGALTGVRSQTTFTLGHLPNRRLTRLTHRGHLSPVGAIRGGGGGAGNPCGRGAGGTFRTLGPLSPRGVLREPPISPPDFLPKIPPKIQIFTGRSPVRHGVSGRGGAVGGRGGGRGLVLVRERAAVHGLPARRPAGRGPAGPGPPPGPRRVRPAAPRGPGRLRRAGAGGRGRVRRGQHWVRGRAAAAGGAGGGPRGHLPQDDGGPHAAGERGPARGQRLG